MLNVNPASPPSRLSQTQDRQNNDAEAIIENNDSQGNAAGAHRILPKASSFPGNDPSKARGTLARQLSPVRQSI